MSSEKEEDEGSVMQSIIEVNSLSPVKATVLFSQTLLPA